MRDGGFKKGQEWEKRKLKRYSRHQGHQVRDVERDYWMGTEIGKNGANSWNQSWVANCEDIRRAAKMRNTANSSRTLVS